MTARSTALPLLAGSLAVGVLAVAASWLVSAATIPYGVPVGAVVVTGLAVAVLVSGLGLSVVARRWPARSLGETAAGLVGPVALGGVVLGLSTSPVWVRVVALAAFGAAGVLGLRAGDREASREARPRRRTEVGAGTLEFVGVAILAAVLVVATVGAVASSSPQVRESVKTQICRILGGDCSTGSGTTEAVDLRPECEIYSEQNEVSATIDIAFVRVAGGGIVQRSEKSDGTVEITLLNEGRGGGVVAAGAHGKARIGENSFGVDVEAEAAATVGIQAGETYLFNDADDADAFQDYLQGELAQDTVSAASPLFAAGNWVVEKVSDEQPPTNAGVQKTYTRFDVAVEASAEASAGFGSGAGGDVSVMEAIGVEHDRGADPEDPADDRSTTFIQIDWSAAGSAGLPVVAGLDASYATSGIIKVTTDAEGNPVEAQFVDRTSGGFEAGLTADQDSTSPAEGNPDGEGFERAEPDTSGKPSWNLAFTGGEDSSTVVSQTMPLDTPERQQAFADWIGAAGGTNILATMNSTVIPGVGSGDGDDVTGLGDGQTFADLVHEESQVSVVEYDGTTWGLGLGGGASLAAKFSADFNYDDQEASAVEAAYLGAPDASGQRPSYDLPECVG